jgi:transcriptional regulator with XRE-family HTH domain
VLPDAQQYGGADSRYIRRLLASAHMTQGEAARRLGISIRQVNAYCSGRTKIPYLVQLGLEQIEANKKGPG